MDKGPDAEVTGYSLEFLEAPGTAASGEAFAETILSSLGEIGWQWIKMKALNGYVTSAWKSYIKDKL